MRKLTWEEVFNHDLGNRTPEWVLSLPTGMQVCNLCGAVVHDNTDWLHITFHEKLGKGDGC